ncbi:MAG: efflux RND transporter periplasmic adaptor subunit [Acidobacteria bacterium]|nr:MAG: efflux RND transporter periplasmic adaptor subunit [Acidobacteriota bacterium]
MNRKKLLIGVGVVVILGAIAYANIAFKKETGVEVTVEKIEKRDLQALVSASGKIQPKRSVNVSAETMGKVVDLKVNEGDTVAQGQFLMQIDPRNLQTAVNSRTASLAANRSALEETKKSLENAQLSLKTAQDNLRRQTDLFKAGIGTKEVYERAQDDVKAREGDIARIQQSITTQQTRLKQDEANLESAEYDLNKVRLVSPIAGIVTKRNIEEGETVVTGTMNNAGTVLLIIADMSVIEAEVEVDETDIPNVAVGQIASIKIDAFPDKKFAAKVTEVGNSPITVAGQATRATNFKVTVQIEGLVPDVRPGFTCTAEITTATRQKVVSVPIQATTVREMVVDANGQMVREPIDPKEASRPRRPTTTAELKPGQERKELEGVFVVKDGRAVFTPLKVGIAGDKFFEVLDGLKEGDEVITGPFASVRAMKDGDQVKISTSSAASTTKK